MYIELSERIDMEKGIFQNHKTYVSNVFEISIVIVSKYFFKQYHQANYCCLFKKKYWLHLFVMFPHRHLIVYDMMQKKNNNK